MTLGLVDHTPIVPCTPETCEIIWKYHRRVCILVDGDRVIMCSMCMAQLEETPADSRLRPVKVRTCVACGDRMFGSLASKVHRCKAEPRYKTVLSTIGREADQYWCVTDRYRKGFIVAKMDASYPGTKQTIEIIAESLNNLERAS